MVKKPFSFRPTKEDDEIIEKFVGKGVSKAQVLRFGLKKLKKGGL